MSKRVKLVPLLREGADDVERALLVSARRDGPPDSSARLRTLEAVKAASRAAAVAAAGVGVARWLSALKPGLLSWLAVGGVVAAVTLGAAVFVAAPDAAVPGAGTATTQPSLVVGSPKPPPAGAGRSPPPPPPAASASSRSMTLLTGSATVATPAPPVATAMHVPHAVTLSAPPSDRSHDRERPRPIASSPVDAFAAPTSPPALEATPRAAASVASPDPSLLPLASPEPSAPLPSASSAPEAPPPAPTSLHDEAALLESVRASLATSHVARALTLLDEYSARFAAGTLAEEAVVLRVEALLAAGRREEARRTADDFARRYPESSYLPRVRALIDARPPIEKK